MISIGLIVRVLIKKSNIFVFCIYGVGKLVGGIDINVRIIYTSMIINCIKVCLIFKREKLFGK